MADLTSSLEADLLAALHASDSFSTTLAEPEHHHQPELQQPEMQPQPQPDPEKPTPAQVQPEPPQPSHETVSAQDQQTARDLVTKNTEDFLASLNNAMAQPPPCSTPSVLSLFSLLPRSNISGLRSRFGDGIGAGSCAVAV